MLQQLKDRISNVSTICSIELQWEASGDMVFNWVVLSRKKQVLVLEHSGVTKGDINALVKTIPTSTPLILSLSGKGVLHKKVEQQGDNKGKLFDYIFPNARITDYLIQTVLCQDNSFQVSVVRKEQVDNVLNELTEKNYDVLSISFGPFSVLPMFKLLNIQRKEVQLDRHSIQIDQYTSSTYTYNAQPIIDSAHTIQIGNDEIPAHLVVPYAMAFQFLIGGECIEVSYDAIQALSENYKDKRLFNVLGWGSLSFFFLVLLLNTGFYTLVSGENNELTYTYNTLQTASLSTQKNVDDFNEKESFLVQYGWLNPSIMSFYSDRIAASLPQAIQLTTIEVCPFNKSQTRQEKKETFEQDMIVLKGIASRPTDINQWTKQLEEYPWINQVKVQDYTFDHKIGRGTFTIHIKTSGELE